MVELSNTAEHKRKRDDSQHHLLIVPLMSGESPQRKRVRHSPALTGANHVALGYCYYHYSTHYKRKEEWGFVEIFILMIKWKITQIK